MSPNLGPNQRQWLFLECPLHLQSLGGQDRTAPNLPDMYSVQHVFYECICIYHLYSLVSYHCECVEKKMDSTGVVETKIETQLEAGGG